MGQLVGHHAGDAALSSQRCLLRLRKEEARPVGHQPWMLHGVAGQGNRNLVELFVGVGNAEVLLEEIDDDRRRPSSVLSFRAPAARHDNAERGVVRARVTRVNDVHRADGDRHQVARQGLRFRKFDRLHAARAGGLGKRRRVRESVIVLRNLERELPGHLVRRLVEAREGLSRRDVFELRIDVPPVAVLDLENALHILAADLAFVVDVECRCARLNRLVERESHQVLRLCDCFGGKRPTAHRQRSVLYRDLVGVQPEY